MVIPHLKNEALEQFLASTPEIDFIKDDTGRYVFVNERFANQCGVRPDYVIGKTPFEVVDMYTAQDAEMLDAAVWERRAMVEGVEHIQDRFGRFHDWVCFKMPAETLNGKKVIVGVVVDAEDFAIIQSTRDTLQGIVGMRTS